MAETEESLLQDCVSCGTSLDVTDQEPLGAVLCPVCGAPNVIAAMIDHFELLEVLGRGGMGVVYKARDTSLDRLVAIKLLRRSECTNPEQIAQLETEAAITASINHPHVVKVFTTGMDHGRFYIAMELVDRGTLDRLIDLQGRVAEAQVLSVGIQIASGLLAAHQVGLIHRDVKPGNILFFDAHTAKIVDFGLAIFMADEEKVRGEVWGTPYYVAPEKLDNKPEDFRSDIYSLGGTLFHALSGRPPFEAETASLVALKHLKNQPMSLQTYAPWVSSSTAYVINRTLNKDPEQRYQSYEEMIEHLEYARTQLHETAARPAATRRVVLETDDEKKAIGWFVFVLLGLMLVGTVLYIFHEQIFPSTVTAPAASSDGGFFSVERQKWLDGKPQEAARLFHNAALARGSQPRLNWANILEGGSLLDAGQPQEARRLFAAVLARGTFSREPQDQELAEFFLNLSAEMTSAGPSNPTSLSKINRGNFEALLPFYDGLKNWELGDYPSAVLLLRQFRQMNPEGNYAWIADLKPLATRKVEEFLIYEIAVKKYREAKNADEKKAALEDFKKLKGSLRERASKMVESGR